MTRRWEDQGSDTEIVLILLYVFSRYISSISRSGYDFNERRGLTMNNKEGRVLLAILGVVIALIGLYQALK